MYAKSKQRTSLTFCSGKDMLAGDRQQDSVSANQQCKKGKEKNKGID